MTNKFQVIVSDPPWEFSDNLSMSDVARGASANYPVLDLEEIKKLPVKELADPNGCILALWVPSSLLQEGLDVMNAWGFKQKQTYIWVKIKKNPLEKLSKNLAKFMKASLKIKGNQTPKLQDCLMGMAAAVHVFNIHDILAFYMGRLFRQTHEVCLIGTNNNGIYKLLQNKSQRSVSFGENLKHSAKPEHLQDSLEIMFPGAKRMEMFARRVRTGWVCLGNEIDGEDIRDALNKLL